MHKKMDDLQVAGRIAKEVHRDEYLKFENHDTYFNNHILPIVQSLRSVEEKIVGFLHDVTEKAVSDENKRRAAKRLLPLNGLQEEAVIERKLQWIVDEFKKHGNTHITRQSPIIEDLNVLTKRTSEKKDYMRYGKRIIDYAVNTGRLTVIVVKKADLLNNKDADRNPNPGAQSSKDKERLANYDKLFVILNERFPDVNPRPFLKARLDRKAYRRIILTSTGRKYKEHRYG